MSESNGTVKTLTISEKAKAFAGEKGPLVIAQVKAHPVRTALLACVCLGLGWYVTREKVTPLSQVAPAPSYGYSQPAAGGTPMKLAVTNQKGEASFVVASARITTGGQGPKLLLNDNRDFRQARQTVMVDLTKFPQFNLPNAQAYVGKHVTAKGLIASYDGRPQVIVEDAGDCTIK